MRHLGCFPLFGVQGAQAIVARQGPRTFIKESWFSVSATLNVFCYVACRISGGFTSLFAVSQDGSLTFQRVGRRQSTFRFNKAHGLAIGVACRLISVALLRARLRPAVFRFLGIRRLINGPRGMVSVPISCQWMLNVPPFSFVFR